MEEIDEEKKQKTELLAIKEFIIEQKYEIRDIKTVVSSSVQCMENLTNRLEELKSVSEEKKSMERQPKSINLNN